MKSFTNGNDGDDGDLDVPGFPLKGCAQDLQVQQADIILCSAGWLDMLVTCSEKELLGRVEVSSTSSESEPQPPAAITTGLLKKWQKHIQLQEKCVSQCHQNALDPTMQQAVAPANPALEMWPMNPGFAAIQLEQQAEDLFLYHLPGGTGKTYMINAVKVLMVHYGWLFIKIKVNHNGKLTQQAGESTEDYIVLISIQNRTQL
ncbi:hypothetical protein BDR06DRAFT_970964 [Suillus hirtellus]|nr:hypothetical protein BDR06DRAFT_970964 [Suillus hirtellus]